jgi:hypothetical protein
MGGIGGVSNDFMFNRVDMVMDACIIEFGFVDLIPNPFKQGHARMGQGDAYEVVDMTFKFEIKKGKGWSR